MIYTITLNPSIDYYMELDTFKLEQTNRSNNAYYEIGGKGINVSKLLNHLQIHSIAFGFIGGFLGTYLESLMKNYPYIDNQLTNIEECTRLNVKITKPSETEINAIGPKVAKQEIIQLVNKCKVFTKQDVVVIAGKNIQAKEDPYLEIIKQIKSVNGQFILDMDSKDLLKYLEFKPLLIKPNIHELERLFDCEMHSVTEIVHYGRILVDMGAQHVIVSRGEKGSLFISQTDVFITEPLKGDVLSAVGAGDAMVGGFIASWIHEADGIKAYRYACACANAMIFSRDDVSITKIQEYANRVSLNPYLIKDK